MAIVNPITPTAEVQTVTVDATYGTFDLTWNGATATVAFDASPATFTTAMDTVTDRTGECVVTGGPGAAGGGTPYTLTWAADKGNVPAPTTDVTNLTGGAGTAVVATGTAGVSRLADPYLSTGAHDEPTESVTPDQGDWQWCMMEVAAWMADEAWSSEPANVSPVIVAVCNSFNDMLDDTQRQGLKTYLAAAPDGVIDTVDAGKETTREWMCSDWLVRTLLPLYLDCSTDTDVLAASTAIKALAPLAAGWTGEAATLAALETAGRAVWAWRNTLLADSFERTGGGGPAWATLSVPVAFASLGGDYLDHFIGRVRGVDGWTSTGSDDGGPAMSTAIRAAHQAAWDTVLVWGPNEFFTGRSADYAFRRGGDYVPGAAFMLIRDTVWALVTSDAIDAAVVLAYNSPAESGFTTYYNAAADAASDELASLNLATNAQTAMLDLIDDLSAA